MRSDIILTTGNGFDGYRIKHYLGIISKEIVFRSGFVKTLDATVTDIVGSFSFKDIELSGSTELIANAKSYLIAKFEEEVRKRGGNAALGIDFESSFGTGLARVAMSGTPVIIEEVVENKGLYGFATDGNNPIKFLSSNMINPFIPFILEYNIIPGGIKTSLHIRKMAAGIIGDIQADLTFTNRFNDCCTVKNCCFLNLKEGKRNESSISWYYIDLPENIYCCLKSCVIHVKKYIYNGDLVEVSETKQINFDEIEETSSVDDRIILDRLEQFDNTRQMLEYVKSIEFSLPEKLFNTLVETLQARWDIERMYGPNKKSTLAALEEKLNKE